MRRQWFHLPRVMVNRSFLTSWSSTLRFQPQVWTCVHTHQQRFSRESKTARPRLAMAPPLHLATKLEQSEYLPCYSPGTHCSVWLCILARWSKVRWAASKPFHLHFNCIEPAVCCGAKSQLRVCSAFTGAPRSLRRVRERICFAAMVQVRRCECHTRYSSRSACRRSVSNEPIMCSQ